MRRTIFGACVFDERHQQQGAGVVVETVPVLVARNGEGRVLEHAGVVRHEAQVLEIELRQIHRALGQRLGLERRSAERHVLAKCVLHAADVAPRHRRPDHVTSVRGCPLTERAELVAIVE